MAKVKNTILLFFLVVIVIISGCVSQSEETPQTMPNSSETQIVNNVSAANNTNIIENQTPVVIPKSLSEMVIQLEDLPGNWTLVERIERTKSDISNDAKAQGWKAGYYVKYTKYTKPENQDSSGITVLENYLSIYPIENITAVFNTINRNSTENSTFEELSDPMIGDKSQAWKNTQKEDKYGNYNIFYLVEFIKSNVYELLVIGGNIKDYELLKDMARKAESRIQ